MGEVDKGMTDWIGVGDRMPEEGEDVLAWDDEPQVGYWIRGLDGGIEWHLPWNQFSTTVTHWMPLPDPPEES